MGAAFMAAGATLLGVALAWMLTGVLDARALLVAAAFLLLGGWLWQRVTWYLRVKRATKALAAWEPGAVLAHLPAKDRLEVGMAVNKDGTAWQPGSIPQAHHSVERYAAHGSTGWVVKGPKAPCGGCVYPTEQEANAAAARWDDALKAQG